FLSMTLGLLGFKVITATDGEEALALARDHQPCLILLDLMMPGMDGFSFREAQGQTPEIADIPWILISALPADRSEILQRLGPLPAVRKPIEIDELITQVVT